MDIYKKCGLRSILSTEALTHSKKIIFYLRAQNKKTKTDLPIDQDIFGQTRLRIVDFQKRIHDFPTVEIVAELVDASVALADHLQVVGLPFVPEQSPETRRIRLETANGETSTRNASAGANNRQIRESDNAKPADSFAAKKVAYQSVAVLGSITSCQAATSASLCRCRSTDILDSERERLGKAERGSAPASACQHGGRRSATEAQTRPMPAMR